LRGRTLLATLTAVACLSAANSIPLRSIDVAELTARADLIVVGRVTTVVRQGETTIDLSGNTITATRFHSGLRADQVLKGESGLRDISFDFLLPDQPIGFQIATPGQYGVFFLKAVRGLWEFVDPAYPSLPALPKFQPPQGVPLDQITVMLGQVINSPQVSDSDHTRALNALDGLRTDLARDVLRRVASTASGDLRLRAAAKLVARNDIAGLEPVATALLHPEGLSRTLLWDLAGSLEGLKNQDAVPTLTKLVKANNPDINRPAAAALRQSGSSAALKALSYLLRSSDRLTRYYAVVGMGEITHQDKWTPAFDEFQQHEQHYLSHWQNWTNSP
jgi:hypothetical protein